jgi:hypothetical protein
MNCSGARIRVLARSIEEPLRLIVEDAAMVLNAVKAGKGAYGYNAGTLPMERRRRETGAVFCEPHD